MSAQHKNGSENVKFVTVPNCCSLINEIYVAGLSLSLSFQISILNIADGWSRCSIT